MTVLRLTLNNFRNYHAASLEAGAKTIVLVGPNGAGKIIVPGVVSHATNLIEHPELIAQRICNFAEAVGRDNVIAGTDCGLGSRLHEDLVWAKLGALTEGARLASKALWAR
jgi:methionine synthase II (cobalamin-independent)